MFLDMSLYLFDVFLWSGVRTYAVLEGCENCETYFWSLGGGQLLQKKSPIYPDNKHLHMLSFYKISYIYGKHKGNYLNSIILNISLNF